MRQMLVLLVAMAACGDEKKSEPAPAPAPSAAPAPTPPAADAAVVDPELEALRAELDKPPTEEEKRKDEVVEALNGLFTSAGVANATATWDEGDLMIVTPPGDCDRKVLTDLRKALAAMKLDPKGRFETMQCNGGPVMKLR